MKKSYNRGKVKNLILYMTQDVSITERNQMRVNWENLSMFHRVVILLSKFF